jgi:hypothetical protein
MNDLKRRSVLAGLGGAFVTAGCVSDPAEVNGTDDPSTRSPQETTQTTRTDDATTTDDWISATSNAPGPDHAISLRNESDETGTVRVRVVREKTGETVYDETHELSAGSGVDAYNLKRADPDGVEAFSVCGELVGSSTTATETRTTDSRGESDDSGSPRRSCVTIRTSKCYGSADVMVRDDEIRVNYTIC